MNLHFLPPELLSALKNLNVNYLTEIRLRKGQPVIIQYRGEYKYINRLTESDNPLNCILCESVEKILSTAMEKSVYAYSEQLKRGFITLDGGVRVGIAGEYVSTNGQIVSVKNVTSLNIRIPHDVYGVSQELYDKLCSEQLKNILLFSPAGFGKTTMLRDFARIISLSNNLNVLIFDERMEISGLDGNGNGFELGAKCDVVRGSDKLTSFINAVRVMSPQVIITDELHGADDMKAVEFAAECGITLIASSHTTDRSKLAKLPFDYFVELKGIGKKTVVYDKNFNFVCDCNAVGCARTVDIV